MKKTLHFVAVAAAFTFVGATVQAQDPPGQLPPPQDVIDNAQDAVRDAARDVQDAVQDPAQQLREDRPALPGEAQQDAAARPQMGVMLGQSAGAGVLITDVRPGGPAYNAGLRRGDYLLKVGKQDVSDPNTVADILAQEAADDRIQLVIWRDARRQDWTVDLRNTGPAVEMRGQTQTYRGGQTYRDPYYYDNRRSFDRNRYYYGTRYYNDPAARFGYYYSDPYRGWNNRYTTGFRGGFYGNPSYGGYLGNGLYLNGRGGGLRIGGFGINW